MIDPAIVLLWLQNNPEWLITSIFIAAFIESFAVIGLIVPGVGLLALISGRYSSATEDRATELKIEDVYNGTLNKIPPYEALKEKYKLSDDEIAYVGDDIIDIPVMEKVAVPIATQNASPSCKDAAVHITQKSGGDGAFREAVEWILSEQGRLDSIISDLKQNIQNQ